MTAPLKISCDVTQGFAFEPSVKRSFGYLTALTFESEVAPADIGGGDPQPARKVTAEIPADLAAVDPQVMLNKPTRLLKREDGTKLRRGHVFDEPIVGVLDRVDWDGGPYDELTFSFNVSAANWGRLDRLFRTTIDVDTLVLFSLLVYKWDYVSNQYFVRFCTNGNGENNASLVACRGHLYWRGYQSPQRLKAQAEARKQAQTQVSGDTVAVPLAGQEAEQKQDEDQDDTDRELDVVIEGEPASKPRGFRTYRIGLTLHPPDVEHTQFFEIASALKSTAKFRWHEP